MSTENEPAGKAAITEISFERTTDEDLIRNIVTHPDVYPHLTDDFSPKAEDWKPPTGDPFSWVIAQEADEILGIFMLAQENPIFSYVSCAFLPEAGDERAKKAAMAAVEWVWANTKYLRLVAHIPGWDKRGLSHADAAGMKYVGNHPSACAKNGRLWNQIIMGISRPPMTAAKEM